MAPRAVKTRWEDPEAGEDSRNHDRVVKERLAAKLLQADLLTAQMRSGLPQFIPVTPIAPSRRLRSVAQLSGLHGSGVPSQVTVNPQVNLHAQKNPTPVVAGLMNKAPKTTAMSPLPAGSIHSVHSSAQALVPVAAAKLNQHGGPSVPLGTMHRQLVVPRFGDKVDSTEKHAVGQKGKGKAAVVVTEVNDQDDRSMMSSRNDDDKNTDELAQKLQRNLAIVGRRVERLAGVAAIGPSARALPGIPATANASANAEQVYGDYDNEETRAHAATMSLFKHRPGVLNLLHAYIRDTCLEAFGIVQLRNPNGGILETPYPAEPFRPDFTVQTVEDLRAGRLTYMWSAGPCNPFNDRAAHIITREILDRGDFEFVADDFFALYKMVSSHIDTTLRTKWRKQQSPVPHDVQISDRIDDANKERSRKTFRDRAYLVASVAELQHLLIVFMGLKEAGTSTDEEGERVEGVVVYDILRKTWRSEELNRFCKFLSKLLIHHPDCVGQRRPHLRVPSKKVSLRPPVRGLPRNWYDDGWFEKLSPGAQWRLDVREPVPLDIPESLLKYVA